MTFCHNWAQPVRSASGKSVTIFPGCASYHGAADWVITMSCMPFAFLMLMFSCQPTSMGEDSLDHILQRNALALGSSTAWQQVESLRIELDIREPGFEVTGTYLATREIGMRIDIKAGDEAVFSEGLYQDVAWQWTPGNGYRNANEQGTAALRHGIEGPGKFYTLKDFHERGGKVSLSEAPGFAEPGEWQLEFTLPDGHLVYYFVDQSSYLTTRELTRRAFHPDQNPLEVTIESRFTDPVSVDGIVRFRTIESRNLETGEWLGTTKITAVEHNAPVPKGFYSGEELR